MPTDSPPTLWLTGLSGAGKTTLARTLTQALNDSNRRCVVLDGDALRSGLNRDLGFSPDDRSENIIIGTQRFLEVYVSTPLEVCETVDAKGLYRKARRGELAQFTGVSAPYEPPEAPRLAIDPMRTGLQPAVSKLLDLIGNATT
jgi:adenylylsulfate kinase